jgi:hypothetical protein
MYLKVFVRKSSACSVVMCSAQAIIFARREVKFRLRQQSELQALLKRIEVRRKEHLKQRTLDSKRLLQRNRNVQAVLESKQVRCSTSACVLSFTCVADSGFTEAEF